MVVIFNLSHNIRSELFDSVLFYLRSFLIAKYENQLEIFINLNDQVCKKVYSTESACVSNSEFGIKGFFSEYSGLKELPAPKSSNLSHMLSMILCQHNARKSNSAVKTAVVVVNDGMATSSSQYVQLMNALFEAQKNDIKINVVDLVKDNAQDYDSVLLKQAASITAGFYIKAHSDKEIIPILLNFAPDLSASARSVLNVPKQENVDFRGSCFCHGKVVDLGYVCSVCLSGIL